jgi:hypothetical protein
MYKWITPVVRGAGNQHCFSGQQLLGLAAVSAMYSKRWTTETMGNAVLRMFSETTDAVLLDWLGPDDGPGHSEEVGAAFDLNPLFLDDGRPMTSPAFKAVAQLMKLRMERAEDAVRRRLLGQRDRFSRPTKSRGRRAVGLLRSWR